MAAKKKITKKPVKKASQAAISSRQVAAIIMFALSVFLLFVAILPIKNSGWNWLHTNLLSVFGLCTYLVAILFIVLSLIFSKEEATERFRARFIEGGIIILLINVFADVVANDEMSGFAKHFIQAFNDGVKGGGFFGGLLGYGMEKLLSKAGAIIVIILLVFVFAMIFTKTTMADFVDKAKKPVKKIETQRKERKAEKEKAKFNPNIPLDGDTKEKPFEIMVDGENLESKKQHLMDAYNDDFEEKPKKERRKAKEEIEDENSGVDPDIIDQINETAEMAKGEVAEQTAAVTAEIAQATSGIKVETGEKEYRFPPISLLHESPAAKAGTADEYRSTGEKLLETLREFNVNARIINISRGPSVTRYEIELAAGIKISKVTNLSDDIAMKLAVSNVRIAPVPGKSAIGIEVPNRIKNVVSGRDIIEAAEFSEAKSKLTVALGKDIGGGVQLADISKMPHLLVAGTTGSGKSVCVNSMLISILYKASPDDVKFLIIDPKFVEFTMYNGMPHMLVPVVTDPRKAAGALGWAVTEMEHRYSQFAETGTKDIKSYNKLAEKSDTLAKMPSVVIVIDEFADLMMAAPKDVEDSVCRIAQKARAAGMHLIIATQRPSADVFTGLIKSNIPSRISLKVSSQVNSQIILDQGGAEKLLGNGDMLFSPIGANKPIRIQGCYLSDDEIHAVVDFIKNQYENASYDENVAEEIERHAVAEKGGKGASMQAEEDRKDADDMLPQAIECILDAGQASTSLLQRRLKLGYARAGRIIDQMEERGIVGPYEGSKPRRILITRDEWMEMQATGADEEL